MKNLFFPLHSNRRAFLHIVTKCLSPPQRGFMNLRGLLGLTLVLSGVALAIFAGKDGALRRPSEPERYMPVPGGDSRDEAAGLGRAGTVLARPFDVSYRPFRSRMGASRRSATCTHGHRRPSGTTSEA